MDLAGAGPNSLATPPHTGTTIVACAYNGGVVLGADSRVSTGTYISNRASDKITPLCDSVYLLRSGSAADTQAVSDYGEREGVRGGPLPLLLPATRASQAAATSPPLQCATSRSSTRCSCSGRQTSRRWPTWSRR